MTCWWELFRCPQVFKCADWDRKSVKILEPNGFHYVPACLHFSADADRAHTEILWQLLFPAVLFTESTATFWITYSHYLCSIWCAQSADFLFFYLAWNALMELNLNSSFINSNFVDFKYQNRFCFDLMKLSLFCCLMLSSKRSLSLSRTCFWWWTQQGSFTAQTLVRATRTFGKSPGRELTVSCPVSRRSSSNRPSFQVLHPHRYMQYILYSGLQEFSYTSFFFTFYVAPLCYTTLNWSFLT